MFLRRFDVFRFTGADFIRLPTIKHGFIFWFFFLLSLVVCDKTCILRFIGCVIEICILVHEVGGLYCNQIINAVIGWWLTHTRSLQPRTHLGHIHIVNVADVHGIWTDTENYSLFMIMCKCFCTVGSVWKCAPRINTFYCRADFCVLIISHN